MELKTEKGQLSVTTDAVVWIEIFRHFRIRRALIVTTDAVVWIEIHSQSMMPLSLVSPLMQWCGLKFHNLFLLVKGIRRHH